MANEKRDALYERAKQLGIQGRHKMALGVLRAKIREIEAQQKLIG